MHDTILDIKPEKRKWDVIVIGTGMGGAVLGYALAKAGRSVLFLEKGKMHLNGATSLGGDYAENIILRPDSRQVEDMEILERAGRYKDEIQDVTYKKSRNFVPFIGSGTGGSTALYGMALERFSPEDFCPRRYYPNAKETTLPEQWPITYEDLRPYYDKAEGLFRIRGTADPLRKDISKSHLLPPPPLTQGSKELYDFFSEKGLHPYRLPMACEFVPGCKCCQGYLCDRDCKNDSARICLEPAIRDYGSYLLSECEVLTLEEKKGKVTNINCYCEGRYVTFRADTVVLAAGALETPRILLNSRSAVWPSGLANASGILGKNLMRHYVDLYAVALKTKEEFPTNFKELAFNDYYVCEEGKFGTIQSFGALPPPSVMLEGMKKDLKMRGFASVGSFLDLVKPLMRWLFERTFSRRIVLASIVEDLPYNDNLVMLSEKNDARGMKKLLMKYRLREYDLDRVESFRKVVSKTLKPYSFIRIKQAENNERIAHACGTCRFGSDPGQSVLDANNRAHGITNLYVVDSSFMPSSGGTNPALTIAANALRVAEHLLM